MNRFKYGMVIGRFQTFHKGHAEIIRTALELCDKVVVYVGSVNVASDKDNPFSYIVRDQMIQKVFESDIILKRLIIRPLPDIGVGNNEAWGQYVINVFEAEFNCKPDLYVTGYENIRTTWFSSDVAPGMSELRLSRNNIDVSASKCREYLRDGNKSEWSKCVPSEIICMYDILKQAVDNAKEE